MVSEGRKVERQGVGLLEGMAKDKLGEEPVEGAIDEAEVAEAKGAIGLGFLRGVVLLS